MSELTGKVCIVTGAAQGIGAAILSRYAEAGASVVGCDINVAKGQQQIDDLKNNGVDALFLPCDVGSHEQIRAVVDKTVEQFGGLDVVVNNAAILPDPMRAITEFEDEDWMRIISINLGSVFRMCSAVIAISSCAAIKAGNSVILIGGSSGMFRNISLIVDGLPLRKACCARYCEIASAVSWSSSALSSK